MVKMPNMIASQSGKVEGMEGEEITTILQKP